MKNSYRDTAYIHVTMTLFKCYVTMEIYEYVSTKVFKIAM